MANANKIKRPSLWARLRGRGAALVEPDNTSSIAFRTGRREDEDDAAPKMADENSDFLSTSFGLHARAFTLLPDPDFLYWSPGHKRAFSVLEYGIITRAPITVITGEVGAGKTTLLQAMLEKLSGDTVIGLISNAHGNRGDLLRWALSSLDVPCDRDATYVETFQILQNFLIQNYAEGRYTILVIDEAQQLTSEGLEELRMLTNINSGKDELLQLVLIGQPELREIINRPSMRQFAQRIMATYHLGPMDHKTTGEYIRHRLVHAGGNDDQFSDSAIELIYQFTGGVPRLINKVCDFSIVYAVTAGQQFVDEKIVHSVVQDGLLQGSEPMPANGEIV